jgi:hypothetical protein
MFTVDERGASRVGGNELVLRYCAFGARKSMLVIVLR